MNTENILSKFKNYLEEDRIILASDKRNVDLYSFFKALTELKTETKRSSKQVQASLISFKEAFAMMEEQFKSQEKMRNSLKLHHDAEISRIIKAHIIELIDSHDRAERNINESEHLFFKLKKRWFNIAIYKRALGLSRGMKLSLEHIKHALDKKGVNRIDTIGAIFNPKLMKIAEVEYNPEIKNLQVLDEAVAGYTGQDGQVIRYAEVIVNKHEGNQK